MADTSMAMVWQSAAVVVLAIALPLLASFLLDGVVALAKHHDRHKFVDAFIWSVTAAGAGLVLWNVGTVSAAAHPVVSAHGDAMGDIALFLLPYSIGVAVLAAFFRIPRVAGR